MSNDLFHPYSRYLEKTFGGRTYKVTVGSRLTCPTRDGSISTDGCAFCDVRGSASYHGKQGRGDSVREQLERRLPGVRARFGASHFLAYFQSYTNTYGEREYLRDIYTQALETPGISGLCIGTRPDCLPDDVLELLEELGSKHYVSLELGVQSFENPSLEWLKRGHDRDCSINALNKLRNVAPSVHTCAHLMLGSPTDAPEGPREAALILNDLGVRGVKLHQLMVLENTELAERFRAEPFPVLSLEEYAARVSEFLNALSPEIYIERLYATATHPGECLAPEWSRERWRSNNRLRDELERLGCRQGSRFGGRIDVGGLQRERTKSPVVASQA